MVYELQICLCLTCPPKRAINAGVVSSTNIQWKNPLHKLKKHWPINAGALSIGNVSSDGNQELLFQFNYRLSIASHSVTLKWRNLAEIDTASSKPWRSFTCVRIIHICSDMMKGGVNPIVLGIIQFTKCHLCPRYYWTGNLLKACTTFKSLKIMHFFVWGTKPESSLDGAFRSQYWHWDFCSLSYYGCQMALVP